MNQVQYVFLGKYRRTMKTKTPATKAASKAYGRLTKEQNIHVCATKVARTRFRWPVMFGFNGCFFFVVSRRSPFAGVVRTCYPLSMAFDGRLTEKSLIVNKISEKIMLFRFLARWPVQVWFQRMLFLLPPKGSHSPEWLGQTILSAWHLMVA